MYKTPRLERFGTLRDLTLGGGAEIEDGHTTDNIDDGCEPQTGGSFCHLPS